MDFTMNDDTFQFSEHETDECPLNISLMDELNDPPEGNRPRDAASGIEANAALERPTDAVDFVECKQQEDFPFIEGTEPTDEVLTTLHKCHAYAHYYEMPSVMHSLKNDSDGACDSKAWTPCWRPILRTVAVAGQNTLLLGGGGSWSTVSLGCALMSDGQCVSPVKCVLVHHELLPPVRRYLALLQEDLALTVLSFPQLKVVSRFSSVVSVTSADENWTGLPSLHITKSSGERMRWSPLYSDAADSDTQPPPPAAKLQVAKILQSKLHVACDRLQRLKSSCRQRQVFISRHVNALQDVLAGSYGACAPRLPLAQTALASVSAGDALCRITSVRCKMLHGRSLLICAAISNCSARLLLSDLELVLSLQPGHEDRTSADNSNHPNLEYKSYVYKSVMRFTKQKSAAPAAAGNAKDVCADASRSVHDDSISEATSRRGSDASVCRVRVGGGGGGDAKSGTYIELLSPCLLRPNKQAYVVGVCRMPVFSAGRFLNITGLVSFRTKPLSLQDKKSHIYPEKTTIASGKAHENNIDSNDLSRPSRDYFGAGKRKEFVSPEVDLCKKADPPTANSKEGGASVVENFVCHNGGVFVKCRYPKYETSAGCSYQVPIKTIIVDALRIDTIKISLSIPPPRAGVSLDSLALIAGSEHCRVLLESPVCGLSIDRLLSRLAQHCDVKQVADVCNVHMLCAADPSASLHLCALSLSQEQECCISADLYFRDVHQGLLLIHTLKAVLPFDAVISPMDASMKTGLSSEQNARLMASEDRVKLLCEKMQKMTLFLMRGIRDKFDLRSDRQEQTEKKSKLSEDPKSHEKTKSVEKTYDEKRKSFLESGAEFTVDRAIYEDWRLELKTLIGELGETYLNIHECER